MRGERIDFPIAKKTVRKLNYPFISHPFPLTSNFYPSLLKKEHVNCSFFLYFLVVTAENANFARAF